MLFTKTTNNKQTNNLLQASPWISDKRPRHKCLQLLRNSLKNGEGGTLLNSFREAGITFTLDPVKDSLRREIGGQTRSSHRNENRKQNVSKQIPTGYDKGSA